MKKVRVHIPRLLCPLCMKNVKRTVSDLNGVEVVQSGKWSDRIISVEYDENFISPEEITSRIDRTDYRLQCRRAVEKTSGIELGSPKTARILD